MTDTELALHLSNTAEALTADLEQRLADRNGVFGFFLAPGGRDPRALRPLNLRGHCVQAITLHATALLDEPTSADFIESAAVNRSVFTGLHSAYVSAYGQLNQKIDASDETDELYSILRTSPQMFDTEATLRRATRFEMVTDDDDIDGLLVLDVVLKLPTLGVSMDGIIRWTDLHGEECSTPYTYPAEPTENPLYVTGTGSGINNTWREAVHANVNIDPVAHAAVPHEELQYQPHTGYNRTITYRPEEIGEPVRATLTDNISIDGEPQSDYALLTRLLDVDLNEVIFNNEHGAGYFTNTGFSRAEMDAEAFMVRIEEHNPTSESMALDIYAATPVQRAHLSQMCIDGAYAEGDIPTDCRYAALVQTLVGHLRRGVAGYNGLVFDLLGLTGDRYYNIQIQVQDNPRDGGVSVRVRLSFDPPMAFLASTATLAVYERAYLRNQRGNFAQSVGQFIDEAPNAAELIQNAQRTLDEQNVPTEGRMFQVPDGRGGVFTGNAEEVRADFNRRTPEATNEALNLAARARFELNLSPHRTSESMRVAWNAALSTVIDEVSMSPAIRNQIMTLAVPDD